MVLESTIVCVDNSEFSRNGDFPPTRFACQVDSVNMLCSVKVQANVESSVGLLTLAGRSARILVTSTRDLSRIFTSMHDVKHDGNADVVAGIQKAQLALKHRHNPRQRQRIVVFVASPIAAGVETLVRLGKSLKKNSVAVDVVNIGVEGENMQKIDSFISAVNSNDNSHALHVEADGANLADALMNSDIYLDRDAAAAASAAGDGGDGGVGAGGDGGDFAGMDAADGDAELAMVLRMSMEEERARQAAAAAAAAAASGEGGGNDGNNDSATNNTGGDSAAAAATSDGAGAAPGDGGGGGGDGAGTSSGGAGSGSGIGAQNKFDDDADLYGTGDHMEVDEDMDDDEMLRRAIELSKADAEAAAAASSSSGKDGDQGDDDDSKKDGEQKS